MTSDGPNTSTATSGSRLADVAALTIVRRPEWGAPPASFVRVAPHGHVWIHHTVTGTPGLIVPTMQGLEAIARGRGFNAFSYSFAALSGGPDNGLVGEGRGFLHQGAHTLGHNADLGIALTGNFENVEPTHEALVSTANLIRVGLFYGFIRPGAGLGGHRDTGFATACPGKNLYSKLATLRAWVLTGPPSTGGAPDVNAAQDKKLNQAAGDAAETLERIKNVEEVLLGRGDDSMYWHTRYLRRELLGDGNFWNHMAAAIAENAGGPGTPVDVDVDELAVSIVSDLGPGMAKSIARRVGEILVAGTE